MTESSSSPIEFPQGGGAIHGIGETFNSNAFSGTADFSLPLPISSGRGFAPGLSLTYSSGSGNGCFGLGVSLSLPSISRQTGKGVPSYTDADTFLYSGDDYLVPVTQADGNVVVTTKSLNGLSYQVTRYQPRTQNDFHRIEYWVASSTESFWQVRMPDNTLHILGKTSLARIADANDSTRIGEWLLEESVNSHGEHQRYYYKAEDSTNISRSSAEAGRAQTTARYLQRVAYGNVSATPYAYLLQATEPVVAWHFELVFDYGEYTVETSNDKPYTQTGDWLARQDPFSHYDKSFEVRTHRLCRHVLMFHRFPELDGDKAVLASALSFDYEENAVATQLRAAHSYGYTFDKMGAAGSRYQRDSLPPIELSYSQFSLQQGVFKTLPDFAGLNGGQNYQLADVFGEGIPGVLYSDNQATLFRRVTAVSRGSDGQFVVDYAAPTTLNDAPLGGLQANNSHMLVDITGNGHQDWVNTNPQMSGYFEARGDTTWQSFVPFSAFPTEFNHPDRQLVDITGDGLPDVVLIGPKSVRLYANDRERGFKALVEVSRQTSLPQSLRGGGKQVIAFTDMLGTDVQHLTRITYNSVQCWPNLGNGRFGDTVTLTNAPQFDEMTFNPSQVFLADIDGSGTSDVLYAHSDRLDIYLNQSGNGFANKVALSFPDAFRYDSAAQISFADIYGNGHSCLILTTTHPTPKHWVYDFAQGHKPYLLNRVSNNMGHITRYEYGSSVHEYLRDKAAGMPWLTALPFPINVVSEVTSTDTINNNDVIQRFRYHHGYYDGVEREFRGFGRVDQEDAQVFTSTSEAAVVAPSLVKTWYHTGNNTASLNSQGYLSEYFSPSGHTHLGDSVIDWRGIVANTAEQAIERPEALRALRGHMLRQEVYGQDNSAQQAIPYTVEEHRYTVRVLQTKGKQQYSVMQPLNRESLSYHFERDSNDPMVTQTVALSIDKYGLTTDALSINYPRRTNQTQFSDSEQQILRLLHTRRAFIHQDSSNVLVLGLSKETSTFEVTGIAQPASGLFTYATLAGPQGLLAKSSTVSTRQSWQKQYYWSPTTRDVLPFGRASKEALASHAESAELGKDEIVNALAGAVSNTVASDATRSPLTTLLQDEGKYFLRDDYWWNPGSRVSYQALLSFYVPQKSTDSFGNETKTDFDPYHLLFIRSTDALNNTTTVKRFDYLRLLPEQIEDMNANISETRYDGLARPVVSTFYGNENGTRTGFQPLSAFTPTATTLGAALVNPQGAVDKAASVFFYQTFSYMGQLSRTALRGGNIPLSDAEAILVTLKKARLLDNDGFIRDGFRVITQASQLSLAPAQTQYQAVVYAMLQGIKRTPVHSGALTAEEYYKTTTSTVSRVRTLLHYSDGFDRDLQQKIRVEDGSSFVINTDGTLKVDAKKQPVEESSTTRWLTSGRTEYNNKGAPVRQYEPYYINTVDFIDNTQLNRFGVSHTLFYDPLGRVVKGLDAKGLLVQTTYHSWYQQSFDQHDTLQGSPFYTANLATVVDKASPFYDANLSDDEKAIYRDGVRHANTPTTSVQDSLGRVVQVVTVNEGLINNNSFRSITALPAADVTQLIGWLSTQSLTDFRGALTRQWQGNLSQTLPTTALENNKEAIVSRINQIQREGELFISRTRYDIMGRMLDNSDPRFDGGATKNFTYTIGFAGQQLKVVGVDNGTRWALSNSVGKPIYARDSQNNVHTSVYDKLHRPTAVSEYHVTSTVLRRISVMEYGESVSNAKDNNLRGQLHTTYDTACRTVIPSYSLQGVGLSTNKTLLKDVKNRVNWPEPQVNRAALLQGTVYTHDLTHNALSETLTTTDPDGQQERFDYYISGRLQSQSFRAVGESGFKSMASDLTYNAGNQPQGATCGNGVVRRLAYEPLTFRLRQIRSERSATNKATLQDLNYLYDGVNNVSYLQDRAQTTHFNAGEEVNSTLRYQYDALYRLINANGREHVSTNNPRGQSQPTRVSLPDASNGQALQNYTQQYHYNKGGNLFRTQHLSAVNAGSTTLTVDTTSNRAVGDNLTSNAAQVSSHFDDNGNVTSLGNNQTLVWNPLDQLQQVTLITRSSGNNDAEYYQYDGGGQRVRKVTERYISNETLVNIDEVIYLGGFEIRTSSQRPATGSVVTVREELHIQNITAGSLKARYFRWVTGLPSGTSHHYRYSLDNHLGSSTMELDDSGQLINYEEYYPYGGTSLVSASNEREVKLRHYRYSGKERDGATGLYYYGFRYYAPWVGRWLNTDPAGTIDGPNLYAFAGNNPITDVDVDGRVKGKRGTRRSSVTRMPLEDPSQDDAPSSSMASSPGSAANREENNATVGASTSSESSLVAKIPRIKNQTYMELGVDESGDPLDFSPGGDHETLEDEYKTDGDFPPKGSTIEEPTGDDIIEEAVNAQRDIDVVLWRGTDERWIEGMLNNGTAGGLPRDPNASLPTDEERDEQVSKGTKGRIPEYSASIETVASFSRGNFAIAMRTSTLNLKRGSGTESGWVINGKQPVTFLGVIDNTAFRKPGGFNANAS